MRAFALSCAVVAVIATAATTARAENCQLKLVDSLTLTQSGDHFLVPVSISGKQLQLKFELADAYTGITARIAKELGLTERTLPPE